MRSARHAFTRSSLVALSAIAVAGTPVSIAGAQQAGGAWRVQPTVGVLLGSDRDVWAANRLGPSAGLEVSLQRGARTRLTASAGYHRIGGAFDVLTTGQGQPRTELYDLELVPVSAGAAYDVWQGGAAGRHTAISLGVEAGAVWSRERLVRSTGPDTFTGEPSRGPDDFSRSLLAAPALTVRHAIATRLEATAGVRTLIGAGGTRIWGYPTFSAGLAWRL